MKQMETSEQKEKETEDGMRRSTWRKGERTHIQMDIQKEINQI